MWVVAGYSEPTQDSTHPPTHPPALPMSIPTPSPLLLGSTIYYRCGDPDQGWSEERAFTTAPRVGAGALPYRLGLVGDLGQTEDSLATLDHLAASAPDSVLLGEGGWVGVGEAPLLLPPPPLLWAAPLFVPTHPRPPRRTHSELC